MITNKEKPLYLSNTMSYTALQNTETTTLRKGKQCSTTKTIIPSDSIDKSDIDTYVI